MILRVSMELVVSKVLAWSMAFINIFAFSGLIYRFHIYELIPVALGDAYGIGDVIDLLFAFIIIFCWSLSVFSALILSVINFKDNWKFSIKTSLFSTLVLVGYFVVKDSY
jgi:hypothetical protein